MITRIGLFDGTIRPGQESAFYAYVWEEMLAVWQAFPGLRSLQVLTGESPELGTAYPLVTVFQFDDEAALAAALASPERQRSLEKTKGLLEMFDGRVVHQVLKPLPRP
ncbi:Dabb family protein [Acuticoccus sp. I52.16.1]|uniref:Dabb family protein n=1 Tax=Acuticoccus sp. I52.16.1 TaxID=2928472 RepID=UPI001FD39204|nr:Dabb family protein [Acuticoccus sp. I52.16.1]UOM37359.1 Dabb family protein [Acuticoccus sp. I52.16.1]